MQQFKNAPLFLSILLFTLFVTTASAQKVNDKELKAGAVPLTNITENMVRLEPVSYEYNKGAEFKSLKLPAGQQYGLVAEDVEKVFPQLVKTTKKMVPAGKNAFKTVAVKTIDYNSLIPLLVASIKEQQEEIEALKGELQKMKVAAK